MPTSTRTELTATLESRPGAEYDEDVFFYFLAVERARAQRSKRPLRVLLATVEPDPGKPLPMGKAISGRLFAGLRLSLRETDILGWYEQDRVAGAVLSERGDGPGLVMPGVIDQLEQRVSEVLRPRLRPAVARSLRVRVVQRRSIGGV